MTEMVLVPREPTEEMHHAGQDIMETHNASDVYAAMIAAAPSSPVAGWQPIETAPKDGTRVDLWAGERLADCRWGMETPNGFSDYVDGPGWTAADCDVSGTWHQALLGVEPTHWMPLPQPPALLSTGEAK